MRRSAYLRMAGLSLLFVNAALRGAVKPSAAAAYYQQGLEHAKHGEDDKALEDFKKSIQLDPKRFESYEALDGVFSRHGQWETIVTYWTRFIGLQPNYAQAYCARGRAYSYQHDLAHTLSDANKACSLGDQDCCAVVAKYNQGIASHARPTGALHSPQVPAPPSGSILAGVAQLVLLAALAVLIIIGVIRAMRKAASAPLPPAGERPPGVTFIAILSFLAAALCLLLMWAAFRKKWEEGPRWLASALISLTIGVGLWKLQNWARGLATILFIILLLGLVENSNNWMAASHDAMRFILSLGGVCLLAWVAWYLMLSPRVAQAFRSPPVKRSRLEQELRPPARAAAEPSVWQLPSELQSPIPRPVREKQARGSMIWRAVGDLAKYAGALAIFLFATSKLFVPYLFIELAEHRLDWRGASLTLAVALFLWLLVAGTRKWTFLIVGMPKLLQYGNTARGEVTAVKRHKSGSTVRFRFSDPAGNVLNASLYTRGPCKDLQVGQPVTVLYDPAKPRTNALYPLDDYAIPK